MGVSGYRLHGSGAAGISEAKKREQTNLGRRKTIWMGGGKGLLGRFCVIVRKIFSF